MGDYGQRGGDVKSAITALGLEFSLMTEFTSFVAVDSDPSNGMCLAGGPVDPLELHAHHAIRAEMASYNAEMASYMVSGGALADGSTSMKVAAVLSVSWLWLMSFIV